MVLGDAPGWTEALALAQIELAAPGSDEAPDLVVAPATLAAQAAALGSEAVILEGRGGTRILRGAGLEVRSYVSIPAGRSPELILPLGFREQAAYALTRLRPARSRAKWVRNRAAIGLIGASAELPFRLTHTVGSREGKQPFLIEAAGSVGVPGDARWFVSPGRGDPLTRGVFHVFRPAAREPAWVLKFARIRGHREPFDRDERGLLLARAAGPAVARRAPDLLGRFEVDGFHASVESAAIGQRLSSLVHGRAVTDSAWRSIEAIASWILELGRVTMAPPVALEEERRRLTRDVLARWADRGLPADLVDRLPELPAVLQHNDLGTWNVVVAVPGEFTVLDWESARSHGMPLWDLLYFLVDALAQIDGGVTPPERTEASLCLLRGESRSSSFLFRWLRAAVREAGIAPESVGAIATLCWLHHGLSHVPRMAAAEQVQAGSGVIPPIERIAPAWLQDPALGVSWSRWRD